jgi:hypothetical protein
MSFAASICYKSKGRNDTGWDGSELTLLGSGAAANSRCSIGRKLGICGREPRRPNLALSGRTSVVAKMS